MSKVIGGIFGGGGGGTSTVTNTTSLPPEIASAIKQNLSLADQLAQRPYQGYGGERIAGFSPLQEQAFGQMQNQMGAWQGDVNSARNAFLQGANFRPQNVFTQGVGTAMAGSQGYNPAMMGASSAGNAYLSGAAGINRGGIRDVNAGSFLSGNIGAYQNPYQQQVIDQAMNDLNRQEAIQSQGLNAQAIANKAFGGSRNAIMQAEAARNNMDTRARTLAGLRQQGFDTAANLMQQDLGRGLQAGLANQGVDMNVLAQNAGFGQQANLANQAAQNQMAQFNAGLGQQANAANQAALNQAGQFGAGAANQAALTNAAAQNQMGQFNAQQFLQGQLANQQAGLQGQQLRLGAGGQLGQLGALGQQLGLQDINALMGMGSMQQELAQNRLNLGYEDFLQQRDYPLQQLALRQAAIGSSPLTPTTSSTSPTAPTNFFGNALGGALSGASLAKMLPSLGISTGTGAGLGALAGLL